MHVDRGILLYNSSLSSLAQFKILLKSLQHLLFFQNYARVSPFSKICTIHTSCGSSWLEGAGFLQKFDSRSCEFRRRHTIPFFNFST